MLLKYKIRKLLQPNNQMLALHILRIVLVVVIIIILLTLSFELITNFSENKDKVKEDIITSLNNIKAPTAETNNTLTNVNYTLITQKNIFGNLSTIVKQDSTKDNKPATQAPLALIGTVLTSGASPYAIIENTKEKIQDAFSVNDNVFEYATLVGIYKNRVEIDRNGIIEILKIDDIDSGSGDDEQSGNIQYLDAAEVQNAISNLPVVMTQARAIPYWQEGKPVGLRLFSIKKNSIFEKVGLKNGDILKNINGRQLGDFSKAMALFEELKNETSLSIELERNKTPMTLQYKIR